MVREAYKGGLVSAFEDGYEGRDIQEIGEGGMSLAYWLERRKGAEAREAEESE